MVNCSGGLLAGISAYIVSVRTTPVYEASTRLLVSAPSTISGVDPTALVTTQMMTSTYSEMLLDRPVLQGVIDQLKLQVTAENLKKSIKVDVVTNTQLLVVTVENTNPTRSADIANAIALYLPIVSGSSSRSVLQRAVTASPNKSAIWKG